jgi:nuclease S1
MIIGRLSEKHRSQSLERIMPGRTPRVSGFTFILTLLIAVEAGTPAWAWGRLGHRVISRLALEHMTPAAKAGVAALLEHGESLADASLWADQNRERLPQTAPWHYVDVPLDEPKYDSKYSGDDPQKGCVVNKINEFRRVINDQSKPVEERRFALRFLIHCVEDMHMPMHIGDNHDRGGNDTRVQFFDEGTNMHRLWDTGMIERVSTSEDHWLKELTVLASPQSPDTSAEGTVEDWATESLLAARQAYQVPETGERLKPGQKLGDAYLQANLPVVRRRLYQGGVRLALVLNQVFSD